jgi:hypothetical protein
MPELLLLRGQGHKDGLVDDLLDANEPGVGPVRVVYNALSNPLGGRSRAEVVRGHGAGAVDRVALKANKVQVNLLDGVHPARSRVVGGQLQLLRP